MTQTLVDMVTLLMTMVEAGLPYVTVGAMKVADLTVAICRLGIIQLAAIRAVVSMVVAEQAPVEELETMGEVMAMA